MMFYFYIPEGILKDSSTKPTDNKKRQPRKHAHNIQETNEKNTTGKQMKTCKVTTCKKGQQKQRSRFLQEYKSETSYTLEECHVGRNM
jgi:hypothetical protein